MQSLFYGAAAASVAGLLLGAGFKADPQPPMQPQQEAVYQQDADGAADDGFQPAYLQGVVYTPSSYDWASADRPSHAAADRNAYPEPKLETVSYDADPPPHGDDIPTPTEPAASAATTPSSTAPGSSTTPTPAAPGAPAQRQDDQNAPSGRSSSAATAPSRRSSTQTPPPAQPQAAPSAPAPGQPQSASPQGPQDQG